MSLLWDTIDNISKNLPVIPINDPFKCSVTYLVGALESYNDTPFERGRLVGICAPLRKFAQAYGRKDIEKLVNDLDAYLYDHLLDRNPAKDIQVISLEFQAAVGIEIMDKPEDIGA